MTIDPQQKFEEAIINEKSGEARKATEELLKTNMSPFEMVRATDKATGVFSKRYEKRGTLCQKTG